MPSKFHVASYLCRPKQDVVSEDKAVNKAFELVGRRAFMKFQSTNISIRCEPTPKSMSLVSRHDNHCNAGDVAPEPQTNDQPLTTNVDTADPMKQMTVLNNKNPSRTKQVCLRWMSTGTAPIDRVQYSKERNLHHEN